MEYPSYIKQYKPKGTIVKRQGKTYFVYEATSVRVPGKKYPKQIIKEKVGTIDKNGFHKLTKITLDIDNFQIFEYGFSDYIFSFLDEYKSKNPSIPSKEIGRILKGYIVFLSSNSYFCLDSFYTPKEITEKYKFSTSQQLTSILEMLEVKSFDEISFLKDMIMIKSGNKKIVPKLKQNQINRLKEIGIYERDFGIRFKTLS